MKRCPTAHFIHGAFDPNGVRFIDWLAPFFKDEGWATDTTFDYGWTGIFSALLFNDRWARLLAGRVRPGDIGVGHSNGCAVLARAAEMGAPFDELIFLHPALDRRADIAPHVRRITVLHAPHEIPTLLARFIPFHPWGDMGRVGYRGKDPRFVNINTETANEHPVFGHTGEGRNPKFWGPLIAACADSPKEAR